jgi:hydroxyacylglutathione hydrolase
LGVYFAQHYLDCLSQASYLIGDRTTRRAVVVDPRRDVEPYLEEAKAEGLTVVGVVNTHFHADFLAGHLELAAATGAWIAYGDAARTEYPVRLLGDGERIHLGAAGDPDGVVIDVLHTPGHTPESISLVVRERARDEVPYGVLTGDTLFIGDVGRPDLLSSVGVTSDELARMLHHSVQHRLMGLDDAVRVFPAHGAGSSCGKNLSTEKQSTIGEQRATNYACAPMDEDAFVTLVTADQPTAPAYFAYDADLNRRLHPVRAVGTDAGPLPRLDARALLEAVDGGVTVLDTRPADDFNAEHLRGSVSVPLEGRFAETVGMLLDPLDRLVLLAEPDRVDEARTRLSRIGFDAVVGATLPPTDLLADLPRSAVRGVVRLGVGEFDAVRERGGVVVLDVRGPGEVEDGAVPGAAFIPLPQLRDRASELDPATPVVVYCAGGWRSSVAAAHLRAQGFADVTDLVGGYGAWADARVDVSA